MRIHMLENVDKALTFLKQQKVRWYFLQVHDWGNLSLYELIIYWSKP